MRQTGFLDLDLGPLSGWHGPSQMTPSYQLQAGCDGAQIPPPREENYHAGAHFYRPDRWFGRFQGA